MPKGTTSQILQFIHRLAAEPGGGELPDGVLLERFATGRDEPAFTALLRRHGGMVLHVCRSFAAAESDAEDAFQATFLALARQAGSIRRSESLAGWLHGVAYRVALKGRAAAADPRAHEAKAPPRAVPGPADELAWREVRHVLHEELARLPEKYRAPLVLCYLEGKTQDTAAGELGWAKGTLKGRLERARHLLRQRLGRRGLGPAAVLAASVLLGDAVAGKGAGTPAVPPALIDSTLRAVTRAAAGGAAAGTGSVAALKGVIRAMGSTRTLKALGLLAACLALVAAGAVVRQALSGGPGDGPDDRPAAPEPGKPVWQPRLAIRGHYGWACYVELASDGKTLATFDLSRSELRFWDTATWTERAVHPLKQLYTAGGAYTIPLFAPDGKTAVAVGQNIGKDGRRVRAVTLFEVAGGTVRAVLPGGLPAFSPDGKLLAVGGDGAVTLYETATAKERFALRLDGDYGKGVACHHLWFSPDGRTLATSLGGVVKLWDTATGKERAALAGYLPTCNPERTPFSPDGKVLVTADRDRTVRLWDVATGQERAALRGHELPYVQATFSPDGKTLATLDSYVGDAAGVKSPREPPAESQRKRPVEVKLWDVETGALRLTLPGSTFDEDHAQFSPDGKTLAYRRGVPGEQTWCVVLWDLATNKERAVLPCDHVGRFSPDSKLLQTNEGANLTFWDTATGQRVAFLKGDPTRQVSFQSYSPDWRLLVTSAFYSGRHDPTAKGNPWDTVETEITVWEFSDRPVTKETRGEPKPAGEAPPPAPKEPAPDQASAAARAWEALQKEAEAAEADFAAKRAAAKTENGQRAVVEGYLGTRERLTARALDLAREHPRDPAAVEALEFALRSTADGMGASGRQGAEAVALVRRDHLTSPAFGRLLPWLAHHAAEGAEGLLAATLEQHPDRAVRGQAAYWLARSLADRAEAAQLLRQMPELADTELQDRPGDAARLRATDPEKTSRRAEELFDLLHREYADVKEVELRPATLGEAAERTLFAMRHLAVGKPAPEIDGKDLDGKALRLSAYRGKVVVLIFCGFWCGPCRALIPEERALAKRLEGKPFTLLWVDSDEDRVLTGEKAAKEGITWRCWWDGGGTEGPISSRWDVRGWPTVYVIDGQGVIRYKQVLGESLDRAVDALLRETKAGKKAGG
jgi:RNA polymerase sigma factor (sigma-70 family)